MSQPLLFLALPSRGPSFHPPPLDAPSLHFEGGSLDKPCFPHDLWISISNFHSAGAIDAGLTCLHKKRSVRAGREELFGASQKFTLSVRERLRIPVTPPLAAPREVPVRAPEWTQAHN